MWIKSSENQCEIDNAWALESKFWVKSCLIHLLSNLRTFKNLLLILLICKMGEILISIFRATSKIKINNICKYFLSNVEIQHV